MHRVLSCVVYTIIEKYFCIDYLSYQSKTVSTTLWNPTFKDKSFKLLLGIGITELLLNLLSFHGFIKKPNPTVLLNFWTCLINNYLSKGFFIIEQNKNQVSFLPNAMKLRMNLIDQLAIDHVMVKKAMFAVSNTIKHLHIQ